MTNDLNTILGGKENSIKIINELLINGGSDLKLKKREQLSNIFLLRIKNKNYKLACCFLNRICKLKGEDVEEIYRIVLGYL